MWYTLKTKVIKWFGDITIYPYPMFIMFGHSGYKMKGKDIRELIETLVPGDIVLRRYDHYISGLLIPGYWTHSSIYIGDNKIIHMLGEGITKEDILTFSRCDDMCIIRKNNNEFPRPEDAVAAAIRLYESNISYDFEFSDNPDKLYCSEFTHICYGKPRSSRIKKKGLILPDDQFNYIDFHLEWRKSS